MSKQNPDYGFDIQKLYLEIMLTDVDTFLRCLSIFEPSHFDRKLETVARYMKDYVTTNNILPTLAMINASCRSNLEHPGQLHEEHYNWLLDEFEIFAKHKALEAAILESADLLQEGNYGPVEDLIKKAVQIGITKDLGTDYWKDPKGRLTEIKDKNGQISTGWIALDEKLYGGFSKGELNIFAGGCVIADTLVEVIFLHNTTNTRTRSSPQLVKIADLQHLNPESYLVNSEDGYVKVHLCRNKGIKNCIKFVLENGMTVVSSEDHFFETSNDTWKYARFITTADTLKTTKGSSKVAEILEDARHTVYDLWIAHENHRYYTNGISSHNSGSGKSLFLANLGVNWALAGLNVLYITFELSEHLVSMRIDSMISGIPNKDIFKRIDDVEVKIKMIGKKSGAMQVKYMPSGKGANDLRSYIREYEIKTSKRLDVVLVDYLDLMHPNTSKISAENLFVKDKYVSEELRNLAMELNILLVTASQLNRSGVEEIEFDHSHIAGGISKINTADNLFGIFTSRAMRERGKYQIQLMKTRSSSGVGSKIDLNFDVETLRISNSDFQSEEQETSVSVVESIKRSNSKVSEKPEAKVRAQTDSTKLRSFLNNLNQDV